MTVDLRFHSPQSRPNRASANCWRFRGPDRRPSPPQCCILFNQLIFNTPKILWFLGRAERLNTINQATGNFYHNEVVVRLTQKTETVNHTGLSIAISCTQSDWQLSALTQICLFFASMAGTFATVYNMTPGVTRPWTSVVTRVLCWIAPSSHPSGEWSQGVQINQS